MGFNIRQPGKIKPADIVYLIAALAVIGALVYWATR